jgi:tripartite-type tricarboxylate transporter receptor subunit TctC
VPPAPGLWVALCAPARTPPATIARLNDAVRKALTHEQRLAVFRQQAG